MDPRPAITRGSVKSIILQTNAVKNPILQCVQIKPMKLETGEIDRWRVVLSDIDNYVQTMLATHLSHIVTSGTLRKNNIVRLREFLPHVAKGKKILLVLSLEVLNEYGEPEKIGEPTPVEFRDEEEPAQGYNVQQPQQQQPSAISGASFYGNKPTPQHQPQSRPMASRNNAMSASASSHGNLYPIEALSPYGHKWTIRARCTHKSQIKTWHKSTGEGKLFSVNLLDESGEIRATGFNDQCDALYDLFQENCVYYISSPCRVQLAKKQFSNLNNDYELTFERDTVVEKAEDQTDVPQIRYSFTRIGDLQNVEKDSTIDVIGVLKNVGEVDQIVSKSTSKPYVKRDLELVDDTNFSVRLTIWGNTATTFDAPIDSVAAFKGVKVGDFGGRSLSLLSSGQMIIDPDIDEAHKLKGWYDAQGNAEQFISHASTMPASTAGRRDQYKTLAQVQEENVGMSDQPEYFTVQATVMYVKQEPFAYPACQSEGCNKKVIEEEPGAWRCEKCNRTFPQPTYRYVMSIRVADHTGALWLSCFDDAGRKIMGTSANELVELKDADDPHFVEACGQATGRAYVFRCRGKMDTFGDQQRVRYHVSSVNDINYAAECSKLAEILRQYNINDSTMFVQ
ncbi:hypothetical protein BDY21DRAFT_380847 [Lineolata rhizophorae]|uniref:Replication protein A subunit n=1 Tax=Lineolata rhizophorae TaxID=578093 RepID=A0A6A6NVP5_9PEZI|nr:hypothetical protein BDY21DRAFT_380847 [Lineolata rhizophorae]